MENRLNVFCTVCNAGGRRNVFTTSAAAAAARHYTCTLQHEYFSKKTCFDRYCFFLVSQLFLLLGLCTAVAAIELPRLQFTGQAGPAASGHGNPGATRGTQMQWVELQCRFGGRIGRCLLQVPAVRHARDCHTSKWVTSGVYTVQEEFQNEMQR